MAAPAEAQPAQEIVVRVAFGLDEGQVLVVPEDISVRELEATTGLTLRVKDKTGTYVIQNKEAPVWRFARDFVFDGHAKPPPLPPFRTSTPQAWSSSHPWNAAEVNNPFRNSAARDAAIARQPGRKEFPQAFGGENSFKTAWGQGK